MEDLLKAKEEELQKYAKIKQVLSDQLTKLKAENQTLKEQLEQNTTKLEKKEEKITQLIAKFNSQSSEISQLQAQLQSKEAELAELMKDKNIKETLAFEAKKAKVEALEMKEKLLKAEEQAANACKSSYPELEKQIKQLGEQNQELKSENEQLKKFFNSVDEFNKILQQLKTGLYNVGEQNAESHKKLDALTEMIGKMGAPPPIKSQEVSPGSQEPTPSSPLQSQESDIIRRKKPSEIMNATIEAQKPQEEPSKTESVEHGRRPSEVAKERAERPQISTDKSIKKESSSKEANPKEAGAESVEEKPKPITMPETRIVNTVSYPSDGIIACPKCGAKTFQEMENRNKIITFTPVKRYGKKYFCKKCFEEWDYQS